MTIINITEMNNEQLIEVFNANSKLQNKVMEDMIDTEMDYIGDQLEYIKSSLSDWSVSTCSHNYIDVRDNDDFIDGLIKMDNEQPLFSDKDKVIIYRTAELRDKFRELEGPWEGDFEDEEDYADALCNYEDEYVEAEEAFEEAVQELAEAVANQFTRILDYCFDRKSQLSHFLEFYAQERLDDNYYIDTTNTANPYELFQDVAYTHSFK